MGRPSLFDKKSDKLNVSWKQIKRNIAINKDWQFMQQGVFRGEPITLIAGGPSLKQTISKVDWSKPVMACGSAFKYLVDNDLRCDYAVFLDAKPENVNYVPRHIDGCQYLIASQCDPSLFVHISLLAGPDSIRRWNSIGNKTKHLFSGEYGISGGPTITLNAMVVAMILGFYDVHIHGFDGCVMDNQRHAYSHLDESRPLTTVTSPSGRVFMCEAWHVQQADGFMDLLESLPSSYKITIYGDGLMADIFKNLTSGVVNE